MQMSKDEYAIKRNYMAARCEFKLPSLGISIRHHSASLEMPNSRCRTVTLVTKFSIRTSQTLNILKVLHADGRVVIGASCDKSKPPRTSFDISRSASEVFLCQR